MATIDWQVCVLSDDPREEIDHVFCTSMMRTRVQTFNQTRIIYVAPFEVSYSEALPTQEEDGCFDYPWPNSRVETEISLK